MTTTCCRGLIAALLLAAAAFGCAKVKPVVIDTKTQLENQILGAFRRLEQDLILSSSVRGAGGHKLSPLQREALEAIMVREFYRDDVDALKQEQVVGEANTGLLLVLAKPDKPERALEVDKLVKRENDSRTTIMRRVIQLNRGLSDKDMPLVREVFARLNRQTARPGDRIQLDNGRWESIAALEVRGEKK